MIKSLSLPDIVRNILFKASSWPVVTYEVFLFTVEDPSIWMCQEGADPLEFVEGYGLADYADPEDYDADIKNCHSRTSYNVDELPVWVRNILGVTNGN